MSENAPVATAAVHLAHLGGVTAPDALLSTTALSGVPAPRADDEDDGSDTKKAREKQARDKKARRARKAKKRDEEDDGEDDPDDEEDDDDEDMRATSVTGRARRRERARCLAIFEAAALTGHPGARGLATHFAFGTAMPRGVAIAALQAALAAMPTGPARPNLAARMQEAAVPRVESDAPGGGQVQPFQRLLNSRAKALGQKS